ncbi:nuclear transport factor 2 family protein [Ideonella azotifigens]|uniref:Nuclear transport factor 2 family protein n=1 Tax=Ideonella azotifigens TaxID=513160 RepID=A0ABN1JIM0_9BURK|nr:nuclear transport factor 2 family protein [Ideonella azotifigens]MCD2343548.1 nuclear transport factor 2 family protein [Ideonella azotifigens]
MPNTPLATPVELATRFYDAFTRRDGIAMQACYHPQAHFTDPVFDLHGAEIGMMWRMLSANARDFRLEYKLLSSTETEATVQWEAWYTFSSTGRPVHNIITAKMQLQEGLLLRHVDVFDFWRWSRQALGPIGLLMGWSGWLQAKVRAKAAAGLAQWELKQADEAKKG